MAAYAPERAEVPAETSLAAPQPREVVIEYREPGAADVRIAGDFNGWVPDRDVLSSTHQEGETCVWRKVLRLAPGTYEYRYVVDGEWCEDPANPQRSPSSIGPPNSVLVVR